MSDNADIAARTERFREAVRAFTPPALKRYQKLMPMKEGVVELREKGASLRLIRELLATVDVSVRIDTIARFLAELNGVRTRPHPAKQSGQTRSAIRRMNDEQNAVFAAVTEPPAVRQQSASAPQTAAQTRAHPHARSARG
jgi:hypothetical protein